MPFAYTTRGVTPDMHIFMVPASPTNNSPRVQSYDIGTTVWTARTNGAVTITRGLNVAGIGPLCICTGGAYNSSGATYTVQVNTQQFNADDGTWTALVSQTVGTQRDGAVCPVVRGSNFLLVGGTDSTFELTDDRGTTFVQEWMLNTYTNRTVITGKRTEAGWGASTASNALAAQYGFIAGGFSRTAGSSSYLTSSYEWDANGGAWTVMASLGTGKFAGGCFTIENETYIVGGGLDDGEGVSDNPSTDNTNVVESWNRTANVWTTRAVIPGSNRRSIGCGAINGLGYAVGGSADGVGTTNYAYNMRYTPTTDAWESDLQTYNTPANIVMRGCSA